MSPLSPPKPHPPRYHASMDKTGPDAQYPGLVFAGLTCLSRAQWERVDVVTLLAQRYA